MYKKVRLIKLSNGCEMWCPEDEALKIIDAMYKDKNKTFELCDNYFKAEDVVSVLTEDFVFLYTKKHFNETEDLIKNIDTKEFYCSYYDDLDGWNKKSN